MAGLVPAIHVFADGKAESAPQASAMSATMASPSPLLELPWTALRKTAKAEAPPALTIR
jgi:hypothetical protein